MVITKVCVFILMIITASVAWSRPSIVINAENTLDAKDQVTLGDISTFSQFEDSNLEAISKTVILDETSFGQSKILTNEEISRAIRANTYLTDLRPQIVVPQRVLINMRNDGLSKEAISQNFLEQVKAACSECEYELREFNVPLISHLEKDVKWQLRITAKNIRGAFTVPLDLENKGRKQTYWVTGFLASYRQVPLLKRALMIGDRIQPEDFEFTRYDMTYDSHSVPSRKEVAGALLRRGIEAGQPVWQQDLKREMAIQAGQIIRIKVGNDLFEISGKAEAQQSGYIGDTIRVVNSNTKKVVSGEIVARGVVLIQ